MKKMYICDDEIARSVNWKQQIDKLDVQDLEIHAIDPRDIQIAINSLEQRRHLIRMQSVDPRPPCIFDNADILVLDFDLFGLESSSRFTTGEELAYLARLYSSAKIIIVLNEFGINRFDLTLVEDINSKADLNLGSDQLCNPGLWKTPPFSGFRPWHWPFLMEETVSFDRRVSEAKERLDSPLLEFLAFNDPNTQALTRASISSLTKNSSTKETELTLRDFVLNTGVYVTEKDAQYGNWSDDDVARIAAASLHKWLERKVLVSQDVLR